MVTRYSTTKNYRKSEMPHWLQTLGLFIWNNLLLLSLSVIFFVRTFMYGNLNWALLLFLVALVGFLVCRVLSFGRGEPVNKLTYRLIMLTSVFLLIIALFIQTMRFIFVFKPGLAEPTLAKLLVRVGIASLVLYVFLMVFATVYYLHAHNMLQRLWNPWLPKLLTAVFSRQNWKHERRSSLIFTRLLVWGGLTTALLLGIGFVAWLLKDTIYVPLDW